MAYLEELAAEPAGSFIVKAIKEDIKEEGGMIAKVVVENAAYSFDIAFSYRVPQEFEDYIRPGCRVVVPFGRANRPRQGLVTELCEDEEDSGKTKAIQQLVDYQPILNHEQLGLVDWLHRRVFCTHYEALRAVIPSGLTVKVKVMCSLGESEYIPSEPNETQKKVLDFLSSKKKPVELNKLLTEVGIRRSSPAFEELVKNKAVILSEDVREKSSDGKLVMVQLCEDYRRMMEKENIRLTAARKKIIDLLEDSGSASLKELCYYAGTTRQTVDKLEKSGVVSYCGRQIFRSPYADRQSDEILQNVTLNFSQQAALDELWEMWKENREMSSSAALLYGVTGSGKSQVYLKLVEQVRNEGKGVIILVPEISLTPQTVELFARRFGQKVAVLHSGLTMTERADEYKRIRKGLADVVVGTRSAVFAPLDNIGLIVIDEEQEGAYASQSAPRYHAREIARVRCRYHKAMLLLASATPSVESFYQAKSGKIRLVTLSHRYLGNQLPQVQIVDMTKNYGFDISQELTAELSDNLEKGQQSIILLNRRGYHTTVRCISCGEVAKCPNCSVALTYHHANGQMMCHYCGYSRLMDEKCGSCGSELMSFGGSGTQRVEDELGRIFPGTDILRMDVDTTMSRMSHETKFSDFAQGKYQIMVGTQMVAKGLNFPNVTLVGVLGADQSLYSQDFRGCERTFSLLTQVVGRCGRGVLPGRALIQTCSPDHPVIRQAAAQDYESFYSDEIKTRKLALYPPFCTLCQIGFSGENESFVKNSALNFAQSLGKKAREQYSDLPLRVMNPCEPVIARLSGKYRYSIVVKCRMSERFSSLMWEMLREFDSEKENKDVRIWIDTNGNDL